MSIQVMSWRDLSSHLSNADPAVQSSLPFGHRLRLLHGLQGILQVTRRVSEGRIARRSDPRLRVGLLLKPLLVSILATHLLAPQILPANDNLPMAKPEEVGMSSGRLKRVNELMQKYIDSKQLAGTVTLIARKGKVVHFEAQGYRHVEEKLPMEKDTVFVIMSMTKPIVSTALMMEFEKGKFLLDDPISKWFPEFVDPQVAIRNGEGEDATYERVAAERPSTIRHVLTHTGGLNTPRGALTPEQRSQLPRFGRRPETVEKALLQTAKLPLNFHPGTRWQYGRETDFVAVLVEKMSSMTMDEYLKERILEPLGMKDTHYNVPESKVKRKAAVYAPNRDGTIRLTRAPEHREPTTYFPGTYGLSSTAADYFRFLQMMLDGGELDGVRLLSPKTVNLMISNHIGDLEVSLRGPGYGFGLGFAVLLDTGKSKEPLSPGSFGWGGAYCTYFFVDPVEELIGIFMTQMVPYRHINVRGQFVVLATQAIIESRHAGKQRIGGYKPLR